MRYIVEIEDFAANAFIESNGKKFLSYKEVEEYGANAVRKLNEKGYNAILSLSRDLTQNFLIRYSDFFVEEKEGCVLGIALKEGITTKNLIKEFRGALPLELLKTFMDIRIYSNAQISEDVLDYIAVHNDNLMDFLHAIMNEADLSDETALDYLKCSFGHKYTNEELKDAIRRYHEYND